MKKMGTIKAKVLITDIEGGSFGHIVYNKMFYGNELPQLFKQDTTIEDLEKQLQDVEEVEKLRENYKLVNATIKIGL